MSNLTISLIQTPLHWEDKIANLNMFEEKFRQVPASAHVIVLPEMFSTGFTMQPSLLAEKMDGVTMCWLQEQAGLHRKIITGSLVIEEEGRFYNRLVWMQPNGKYYTYDKKHLFAFAGEDKYYTPGNKRTIVQVNGWKINLQICYDLRFPVWARQAHKAPLYDILLYVANWPQQRIAGWDTLLKARAIENQCIVIGLNRLGYDKNEIYYSGSSALIDPLGQTLCDLKDAETIATYTFEKENLTNIRLKFPFLEDRDAFILL